MAIMRSTELRYVPAKIESKWQSRWDKDKLYQVGDENPRPKWYELTMYPYSSGDIHIGHWYAMAPSDAHARFKRMQGYNVMHPMGFDSFGLPAENAAMKKGVHPYTWTMNNIEQMRKQLRSMGAIYDWEREIVTCDPLYYKWNQWLFLQFYKAGLAYRAYAPANWCDSCKTVLANEQVVDGNCERCGTIVTRRELNQWFFGITKYADELLDHSQIDWPEKINIMQTNWIGRSEGVEIEFDISEYGLKDKILKTFTTRIDTIFGVTFVVLAPEHPMVVDLASSDRLEAVQNYIRLARQNTEVERLSVDREKTGVFTGAYCINRLNGERIPILVADYVLLTYGTGVVMGVPAHDQRDFEFASKHGLPVKVVVAPEGWDRKDLEEAYLEEGIQVNSGQFEGLINTEGKERIADFIEASGWGQRTVAYRIRDWLISRQRYWGTPIPIIYCDQCGTVPVNEEDLPVLLPEDAEFKPTGESPLKLHQRFINTECPQCGQLAKREADTMDTFVDSSWYQLRFTSPGYPDQAFDPEKVKKWGPVDQYTGGAEHAVMHLLYARFFTRALRDLGLLDFDEPFIRLFSQGHIIAGSQKMSKSRGNVIAPDDYVSEVGADVVRCYLMFLGPWDQGGEWSDSGINGMARWMNRVWELVERDARELDDSPVVEESVRDLNRTVHKTIKRVTDDIERFKFNTALAALMELSNYLSKVWDSGELDSCNWNKAIEVMILLMAPMAPHVSEELWERTGHEYSVHNQLLPEWSATLAADQVVTLVVQVNGRLRDKIEVSIDITEEEAKQVALDSQRVSSHIDGMDISRVVYVPRKLVNVVAK